MSRTAASPDEIEATMLSLAAARGPGKTLGPTDVARALGGDHPDGWGPLMQPVRRVAVRLMKEGRIVILRKGRPVIRTTSAASIGLRCRTTGAQNERADGPDVGRRQNESMWPASR